MKKIVQQICVNSFLLFAVSGLYSGLKIKGGLETIIIGGILLTLGFMLIKPIVDIITFPIRILTFGLSSFIATVAIVFFLTRAYPNIQIAPFTFPSIHAYAINIDAFWVPPLLSYIIISGTIYILNKLITWLFEK